MGKTERIISKKYYLPSRADGLRLHVLVMYPERAGGAGNESGEGNGSGSGRLRGVVQLCHGMCEHKERYLPFMEVLCQNGYAAVIHDHRGHGKSVRDEKDLGYFYDDTGKAIVEDTFLVTRFIKKQFPHTPVHLFGHSMGSLIVRCYLKEHDDEIASLTVCGSPSPNPAAGPGILLAKTVCLFAPREKGYLFQKILFAGFRSCLEPGGSQNAWISYNKENVRKYDADPADGFMFTNNGFLNLFLLMKETYSKKGWQMRNPSLPVLFIAGKDDPCVGSVKSYGRAVKSLQKHGYRNVHARLFPDMRHEILNEKDAGRVYQTVLQFLQDCRS